MNAKIHTTAIIELALGIILFAPAFLNVLLYGFDVATKPDPGKWWYLIYAQIIISVILLTDGIRRMLFKYRT